MIGKTKTMYFYFYFLSVSLKSPQTFLVPFETRMFFARCFHRNHCRRQFLSGHALATVRVINTHNIETRNISYSDDTDLTWHMYPSPKTITGGGLVDPVALPVSGAARFNSSRIFFLGFCVGWSVQPPFFWCLVVSRPTRGIQPVRAILRSPECTTTWSNESPQQV